MSVLLFAGGIVLALLAGLVCWQALVAASRLALAAHTAPALDLLLSRLSAATRSSGDWRPVLHGMRLELPWPWPWRLWRAAEQLAAGLPPADMLAGSSLLPRCLRDQAAQALRQGPDSFAQWCAAVSGHAPAHPLAIRQWAVVIAELAGCMTVLWFLSRYIMPKFEMILQDLGIRPTPLLRTFATLDDWLVPLCLVLLVGVLATCSGLLALHWRRRHRLAAARLLLAGCAAGQPEAALGAAGSFSALCAAAGWRAASPAELAHQVVRAETREALRAAWLPGVITSLLPLAMAVPVGVVVIGLMQTLLAIIFQLEAGS